MVMSTTLSCSDYNIARLFFFFKLGLCLLILVLVLWHDVLQVIDLLFSVNILSRDPEIKKCFAVYFIMEIKEMMTKGKASSG